MGEFEHAVKCPECGTWGAKKSFWKVKCINSGCSKYNSEYATAYRQCRIEGKPASEVFEYLKGKADPNDYSLQIRYQNFRGDDIIYSADPSTVYRKGEYVIARLAPTGRNVTFKLSRIQNRSDVEALVKDSLPRPSGNERRVLRFHMRRGSSSATYEKLREKYPNFQK